MRSEKELEVIILSIAKKKQSIKDDDITSDNVAIADGLVQRLLSLPNMNQSDKGKHDDD